MYYTLTPNSGYDGRAPAGLAHFLQPNTVVVSPAGATPTLQPMPPQVYTLGTGMTATTTNTGNHASSQSNVAVTNSTVTGSIGSSVPTLVQGTAVSSFTKPGNVTQPSGQSHDAGNSNLNYHLSMSTKIFRVGQKAPPKREESYDSAALREHALGVYAIFKCKASNSNHDAIIFCDDGSDCSLISETGADKLRAFEVSRGWMDMTTLHGTQSVPTRLCEVTLTLPDGSPITIVCFTVPELCGVPEPLDEDVLAEAFPEADINALRRPTEEVNILLGADYFALHPKHEIHRNGNLSVMEGVLGVTVQGSHPRIVKRFSVNPHAGFRLAYRESYAVRTSFRSDIPIHPSLCKQSHISGVLPFAAVTQAQEEIRTTSEDQAYVEATGPTVNDVLSVQHASGQLSAAHNTHQEGLSASYNVTEFSSLSAVHPRPLAPAPDTTPFISDVCPVSFAIAKGAFGSAIDDYILGEKLGTTCLPRCGSCKCGRCPLPGHSYSFKEEQELELIQSKLRYLENPGRWVCSYPWLVDPLTLPDNYAAVFATLLRTEKTLLQEPEWMKIYQAQITEHETRGVARKLTPEELAAWNGPHLYISHMCIEQPKSESTPVRVVFNSSQKFKGVSMNDCLAKGPDCYNNSLLGMLIRFREHATVLIGDIKKMYNTVHLEELEQHMHRFLWRECNQSRKPDVWVITRVNLGDRPSGTIAITAKNNTAHMFAHICPESAQMLIYCCYTDDVINSIEGGFPHALYLAAKAEEILAPGEFRVKGWTFGGRDVPDEYKKKEPAQVLGSFYNALMDYLFFPAKLNFSKRKRGVPTGPDLTERDLPHGIPDALTRRIVLSVVMGIYDPLGLLAPFVLQSKLLLRRTWELKLDWDEKMEEGLVKEWKDFFAQMFQVSQIPFQRCLTPENAVGQPQLIIYSDGSEEAYGCAAYIRWQLSDGNYWCRLIMAKSRIAPISRINMPQMELNGAVLSKRLREVIESESRFQFERVHHLIDSETVLCQLYKVAQKFKVFEGVRIGEIQSATNGDMSEWAWIAGKHNAADLVTRPQKPEALGEDSVWQRGPDFLYLPEEDWPVKRNPHVRSEEVSPGEKMFTHCTSICVNLCYCSSLCNMHVRSHNKSNHICKDSLTRCSKTAISIGGIARVISALRQKSFRGCASSHVLPEHRAEALRCIIEEAQCSAWPTRKHVEDQFKHISITEYDKLYVVDNRDPRVTPLSPDHQPQVILPYSHILTYRIMRDCHVLGRHSGRDATLAKFRSKYHTSRAHRIAAAVCKHCTYCKLFKVKLLGQKMGALPVERFSPSPPFDSSVLDLFGPYLIRGEKNPRVCNIKVWGVMVVDLVSRATHIDLACGYDTSSFLVAFRRFAALRGWPSTIYSDPGTQLVGASTEVKAAWKELSDADDGPSTALSQKGTRWVFGPADSPWYQGAAEALIKSAKKAISTAVNNSKLSFSEMHTAFTEVANLLNERPIGYAPSSDNVINILTPNQLLLGRSTASNPGGYSSSCSILSRISTVKELVDAFWEAWTQLYAPTLIKQSKWSQEERPLQIGDIVLVADSNVLRGEYRLARVVQVHPSKDGLIRRVTVEYIIYRTVTKKMKLVDGRPSALQRSVQRLALIIPVEELDKPTPQSMEDIDQPVT